MFVSSSGRDVLFDLGSTLTLQSVVGLCSAVDVFEDVPHYNSTGLWGLVCACLFVVISVVAQEVVFSKKSSIKAY